MSAARSRTPGSCSTARGSPPSVPVRTVRSPTRASIWPGAGSPPDSSTCTGTAEEGRTTDRATWRRRSQPIARTAPRGRSSASSLSRWRCSRSNSPASPEPQRAIRRCSAATSRGRSSRRRGAARTPRRCSRSRPGDDRPATCRSRRNPPAGHDRAGAAGWARRRPPLRRRRGRRRDRPHRQPTPPRRAPPSTPGATLLTHAFNAMPGIHHRSPGPVVAAFDDRAGEPGARARRTARRARASRRSPSRRARSRRARHRRDGGRGRHDGAYRLGSLDVTVRGGMATVSGTETIAGSTLTQDGALRGRARRPSSISRPQAVAALTATPARVLGLGDRFGLLEPGYAADVVVLDDELAVAQRLGCRHSPRRLIRTTRNGGDVIGRGSSPTRSGSSRRNAVAPPRVRRRSTVTSGWSWITDAGRDADTGPFDGPRDSLRLRLPEGEQHEFPRIEDRAEALRQAVPGHLLGAVEEPGVVGAGGVGEGLHAGAGGERRARLVEADVAGAADAEDLQVDAAGIPNRRLVPRAGRLGRTAVGARHLHEGWVEPERFHHLAGDDGAIASRGGPGAAPGTRRARSPARATGRARDGEGRSRPGEAWIRWRVPARRRACARPRQRSGRQPVPRQLHATAG